MSNNNQDELLEKIDDFLVSAEASSLPKLTAVIEIMRDAVVFMAYVPADEKTNKKPKTRKAGAK